MATRFTSRRFTKLSLRMVRYGCINRPFYHIVVMPAIRNQHDPPIEQLGVYDPLYNKHKERIFTCNLERLKYWLAQDLQISVPVRELLGLAGYFPIHPRTYMAAWKDRLRGKEKRAQRLKEAAEKATDTQESTEK